MGKTGFYANAATMAEAKLALLADWQFARVLHLKDKLAHYDKMLSRIEGICDYVSRGTEGRGEHDATEVAAAVRHWVDEACGWDRSLSGYGREAGLPEGFIEEAGSWSLEEWDEKLEHYAVLDDGGES